ncbi:HPP family protein [Halobacteriovorax sp. HLS]|uniref:CBS domain-containing protein n=1 Tax=Halobacteriovorax sp. HLS TaxID=2234000 RepID=UPI000FD80E2B|nr:CBS domain-containing protein [Halobacteriovorax sp. HLS]
MFYLTHQGKLMTYQFSYLADGETSILDSTKPNNMTTDQWEKRKSESNPNKKDFRAIDVMSNSPITVTDEELISNIEKLFSKYQFRHIPVLNNGKICGMISDQDVLRHKGNGGYNYLKSKDIMSILIICAHVDTPIEKISHVLLREKINSIPIVNSEGTLAGIITTSDIIRLTVENSFFKL